MTKITKNQAQDIRYKLSILCDSQDLQADYKLSQSECDLIYTSVPVNGGDWNIPEFAINVIKEELIDYANILRGIAEDARAGGQIGQSLSNYREANELENLIL